MLPLSLLLLSPLYPSLTFAPACSPPAQVDSWDVQERVLVLPSCNRCILCLIFVCRCCMPSLAQVDSLDVQELMLVLPFV